MSPKITLSAMLNSMSVVGCFAATTQTLAQHSIGAFPCLARPNNFKEMKITAFVWTNGPEMLSPPLCAAPMFCEVEAPSHGDRGAKRANFNVVTQVIKTFENGVEIQSAHGGKRMRPAMLTASRNHFGSWCKGLAPHGSDDTSRHDSI
jgi:hypothetical protein